MAEDQRDRDAGAPDRPAASVVSSRRIILFFVVVMGAALLVWTMRPPPPDAGADRDASRAPATTGDDTPGGNNPQRRPDTPRDEIEQRAGQTLTELGAVIEEGGRGVAGRRVEVRDVEVERVESPAVFWVRDGVVRVAVVAPASGVEVRAGQQVNIVGTVERVADTARIHAIRVSVSR